jgi:phospholipase C
MARVFLVGCLGLLAACSSDGAESSDDSVISGHAIEHVVVIVQENHTFDAYFGRYCTAPSGSNPSCTDGPACCEAAPATVIGRTTGAPIEPMALTDGTNTIDPRGLDRNHDSACEYLEMSCGAKPDDPNATCLMDRYVDQGLGATGDLLAKAGLSSSEGGGTACGSIFGLSGIKVTASNWAIADPNTEVPLYRDYARQGAIADRYFQPVVGQTSSNDMFLATAQFEFRDNTWFPKTAGSACQAGSLPADHQPNFHTIEHRKTIADLLFNTLGQSGFGYYHVGFRDMTDPSVKKDDKGCPDRLPALCPKEIQNLIVLPNVPSPRVACMNDPSDDPFRYFAQFGDKGEHVSLLRDYDQLATDIQAGTLPSVAYVKAVTAMDEHPAFGPLSVGQTFVKQTVDAVLQSPKYKDNTLVLITWDEGGGFYDHVSPPAVFDPHGALDANGLHTNSETAGPGWMRLGTRIPLIVLGKFARKNQVSHVALEHSSIVKFLEWNFLGHETGQLGGRESQVNNLGSLLDPSLGVPEKDAVAHPR